MSNTYAVVTGASSGLGKAFAEALAKQNRNLIIVARSREKLHELAHQLQVGFGIDCVVIVQDLAEENSAQIFAKTCAAYDIDLLINNAGFGITGPFGEYDPANLEEMLVLNMVTLTQLIYEFLPQLKRTNGAIINVASVAGFQPIPFMAAYAASKAYVLSLSEALREELSEFNINVLTLCPGATDTGFWEVAKFDGRSMRPKLDSAEYVVNLALQGLKNNDACVTAGVLNKLLRFALRFAPRILVLKSGRKLMGR